MLHQAGTVEEYIDTFELISAQVPRLYEGQYLGYFMGVFALTFDREWGRFTRILDGRRCKLHEIWSARMGQIIVGSSFGSGATRKPHEGSVSTNPTKLNPNLSGATSFGQGEASSFCSSSSKTPVASNIVSMPRRWDNGRRTSTKRTKGTMHLSYQELMDLRNKGLCFKCGEKFHPLHQWSKKSLRFVVVEEDEVEGHAKILALEVEQGT